MSDTIINPLMSSGKQEQRWQAIVARDASRDGAFVFAVTSTGVYCRPSCPSRRPRRERVRFFSRPDEAERAGFRACQRCHPRDGDSRARTVERICQFLCEHADEPVTLAALGERFGINPFHLQRVFKAALVEQLGVKADRIAIELNKIIVRRDAWAGTKLRDGDRLEVVHFVGGGLSR